MVLFYKLPQQWPKIIPLDVTCTIAALRQYIKAEHRIDAPFKLRIFVGGQQRYLKPTESLEDVAAMGAKVVSMNYREPPSSQRKRRRECKQRGAAGDSLARPAVQACDGQRRRQQRHDDGLAEPKRRRLEARNVGTEEFAIVSPITSPYEEEEEEAGEIIDEEAEEEAKDNANEAGFDEEAKQDANQERKLGMFQMPLCGICLQACGMATVRKVRATRRV